MRPLFVQRIALILAGATCLLSGCAGRSVTTADTVMRDAAIQRQQAEQAPPKPNNRGLYLTLIKEMQSKGLFYASLAHVDAYEKQYSADPDVEMLRGDALRETGQNDAALSVYRALLSGKNEAPAEHGVGRVLANQGHFDEAITALDAASKLDPTNVSYLNDLGFAYVASGRVLAARLPIAQAAELAPTNKKVVANLVLYLLMSGDEASANDVISRAELAPETVKVTRDLAAKLALASQQRVAQQAAEKQAAEKRVATQMASLTTVQPVTVTAPTSRPVQAPQPAQTVVDRSATATALAWPTGSVLERFGGAQ